MLLFMNYPSFLNSDLRTIHPGSPYNLASREFLPEQIQFSHKLKKPSQGFCCPYCVPVERRQEVAFHWGGATDILAPLSSCDPILPDTRSQTGDNSPDSFQCVAIARLVVENTRFGLTSPVVLDQLVIMMVSPR